MATGAVPRLVDQLLADSSQPLPLATALLDVIASPEPFHQLVLSSAIHQLFTSFFKPSPASLSLTSPDQLATFFHLHLFLPLSNTASSSSTTTTGDDRRAALADALIDGVWQLDQEAEVLVPLLVRKQRAEQSQSMQVDGAGAGVGAGEEQDVIKQSLLIIAQGREKLGRVVKQLIDTTDLPKQAVLERLDTTLLRHLPGVVSDTPMLIKMEVRSKTAYYYKQQKFNLLREESEGYSKLIVELLSNMGPPHSSVDASATESAEERLKRAKAVNDKVKNLIGNFDLDPSRTLDIFLDTFSDQCVAHYRFFLDFLAVSPWAPKAEAQSRKPEEEVNDNGKGKGKAAVDVGLERDDGNETIAQILGFKFAYYQGQDAPSTVPQNLYLTTALLIWHGFVKLTDLWPHLSPTDDALSALRAKYEADQIALAKSVGGGNALAMAGALVDDDAPSSSSNKASTSASGTASTSTAPTAPPRDPPNQKLALLRALLTIGDLPHSLFILSQFPFLTALYPDLSDLLSRLLAVSLEPAYSTISVRSSTTSDHADEFAARKGRVNAEAAKTGERIVEEVKVKRELTAEAFPSAKKDWTFFFSGTGGEGGKGGWKEKVPRAGDWDEVVEVLEKTYLPFIRVNVSRDFKTYAKVLRIAAADLATNPTTSHPRYTRWIDVLRLYLLPAVSLLSAHTSSALELWRVLFLLPLETRFTLYGEWKNLSYRRLHQLGVRKAEAEKEIKSLLRRLSTENVKKLGKTFARIAHTNPTVVFAVALNQVMSYDNLIVPVVEAARYLTELGYDVLAFTILEALSGDRPKTKEDGTSIALWLQGLATFTGNVYRRWPQMQASLWIILQYLVNQLILGNSKDLVVLRELIIRMTAIEPFADLSDAQVLSLAGGKLLRSEVFQMTEIGMAARRTQLEAQNRARDRLAEALLGKGLAMPLLVNIALQRQACLKTDTHLKSLGALFDQNHAILFQFTELLNAITTPSQLASLVPAVTSLITTFHLDPSVAFDISRPKLRAALKEFDDHDAAEQARAAAEKKKGLLAKLAREKEKASSGSPAPEKEKRVKEVEREVKAVEEEGDIKMEDVVAAVAQKEKEESGTPPPPSSAIEGKANGAAGDIGMEEVQTPPLSPAAPVSPWHPGLSDVIANVSEHLPEAARTHIGSPFFVTFWQLTLYDILYPKERYDAEIARLKLIQREASTQQNLVKPDERDRFIKTLVTLASGLMTEASQHLTARNIVSRRLTREKSQWFAGVKHKADRIQLVDEILQYCIQPRARLSLPDAVYAHQMIRRLHSLNTPGFQTVLLYDRLLTSQISPILFSCTENEARNYGRFIYDVLADLFKWHKDKALFQEEIIGAGLFGFVRTKAAPDDKSKPTHYTHEQFQQAVDKWHRLMVTGFIESFKSGEYMHIKNSILVLTKIAPYFPLDYRQGEKLEKAVGDLLIEEKREDLTILAQGYKAVISKRRKHWINKPAPEPKTTPAATPAATPAPSKASSPVATRSEAPSKSGTANASSSSSTRPSASTNASSSAVPTGPKGLPTRPGARGAEEAKASTPTSTTTSNGASSSSSSALPTRPGESSRRTETNGSSSNSSSNLPARPGQNGSAVDADKLRKEALASKGGRPSSAASSTTAMDPPAAPSASRNQPADKSRPDSRPPSRAASPPPRTSDSDRDRDRRSRDDRTKGRSPPREKERARSVESTHSSRSGRDARDSRDSGRRDDRDRDGRSTRTDDRDRDRDRDRAPSKRDEDDRRGGSSRKDDERRDRDRASTSGSGRNDHGSSSSRRDSGGRHDEQRRYDDSRSSSKRDDERSSSSRRYDDKPSTSASSSSSRREPESFRRREESSRSDKVSASSSKLSREEEEVERAKEKQRKSDEEREKVREDKRRAERREKDDAARRARDGGGRDSSRSNSQSAQPPRTGTGLPLRPSAVSSSSSSNVDRLRPPPASRPSGDLLARAQASLPGKASSPPAPAPVDLPASSSSSRPPTGPSSSSREAPASTSTPGDESPGFSIKGRGGSGSRLFAGLTGGGGESRKRSGGSLADRLAPEEKRPRTDDPPLKSGQEAHRGSGRGDGGGGGGSGRSGGGSRNRR